jgi:hypothetical protein
MNDADVAELLYFFTGTHLYKLGIRMRQRRDQSDAFQWNAGLDAG